MLDRPFRGSDAVRLGLVTKNVLRGPRFRRPFPDVYLPAGASDDLRVRSEAAYLLVERNGGVLAGYSAALLLGADCAPRAAPAEVLVPDTIRRRSGMVVRYGAPPASDLSVVDDRTMTSPARTAWDLARRLDLVEAVVAVDALARAGRFDPVELLARRAAHPGARGNRRLDRVVALADARAESPPETRLRLALVLDGLPAPEVQYRIVDEYGFVVARADLAYPDARLAIEYDGANHYTRARRALDRQRDAELDDLGWYTMRLGPSDALAAVTLRRIGDRIGLPYVRVAS